MKGISDLKKVLDPRPVFVVGNGNSKRFFQVATLARYGWIFGCNQAFRDHHVDLLGFRDDDVLELGTTFKGLKATWAEAPSRKGGHGLQGANGVYLWHYADDVHPRDLPPGDINPNQPESPAWGTRDVVKKGSTGYILAQVALRIGLSPIILVGLDCGPLEGYRSTKTTGDDSAEKASSHVSRYNRFREEIRYFARYAEGKGTPVRKLGNFGEAPVAAMRTHEILGLKQFRK